MELQVQDNKACKNCQTPLDDTQEYCGYCGARYIESRFSFTYLLQELSDRYLGTDNVFLRTISHLLYQPEEVVNGYLNGRRKRYTNAINFFAIALTIIGFELVLIKRFFADPMFGMFNQVNNPEAEAIGFSAVGVMQHMLEYQSLYLMLSIPVFAGLSYLVMKTHRSKLNYTEHLIIVMYSMSLYTIVSAVTSLFILWLLPELMLTYSGLLYLAMIGYGAFYYARIFKLGAPGVIGRTLLFWTLVVVIYILTIILTVAYMISTGEIEVPPKA